MSAFGNNTDMRIQGTSITDFLQAPNVGMRSHDATARSFGDVFKDLRMASQTQLTIPPHVEEAMDDLGIELDDEELAKLQDGVNKAAARGVPQAMVVVDRNTFIVDVAKNTLMGVMHNGPNAMLPTKDEMMVTTNMAIVASA